MFFWTIYSIPLASNYIILLFKNSSFFFQLLINYLFRKVYKPVRLEKNMLKKKLYNRKNLKKNKVSFKHLLILSILIISLISNIKLSNAEGQNASNSVKVLSKSDALNLVIEPFEIVFKYLFGSWDEIGVKGQEAIQKAFIFKVVFMLILFFIIFSSLRESHLFNRNKIIAFIVSLLVTAIGSKFIKTEFIIEVFLPTGAFLSALSLVFQMFIIYEINTRVFKDNLFFSWLIWSLWGVFSICLIIYYSNTLFGIPLETLRGFLGLDKPPFFISTTTQLAYLALGILSILGINLRVQRWVRKLSVSFSIEETSKDLVKDQIYGLLLRRSKLLEEWNVVKDDNDRNSINKKIKEIDERIKELKKEL